MGAGTALAYPVLIAAAADTAPAHTSGIGNYRFWRDLGFVAGAPLVGQAADRLGVQTALLLPAAVAAASGVVVLVGCRTPAEQPLPPERETARRTSQHTHQEEP